MEIEEYLKKVKKYQKNPQRKKIDRLAYLALGIAGESGEVADEIKKAWRNKNGKITEERKQNLINELGDVWNYLLRFQKELGITQDEILDNHLIKIKEKGKI
jgi:NTP pyrophosphatase (non-canonical NTP hydrolase)